MTNSHARPGTVQYALDYLQWEKQTTTHYLNDLDTAELSGDSAAVTVSLEALGQLLARLCEQQDKIVAALERNAAVLADATPVLVDGPTITGFDRALATAQDVMSGDGGLMATLQRLLGAVRHDIEAVQAALSSYASTDVTHAAAIQSAGQV
jgi:hypothetical protein